ncbi:MAG: O-antigen ligase family protein [Desulfosporosinus sp.]|nr:O-antigen ligase family protein [Desulfosporosinus sp.]
MQSEPYLQGNDHNLKETWKLEQKHLYVLFCLTFITFITVDQLKIIAIPQFYFLAISILFFWRCDSNYYTPALCFIIPLSIWVSLYYIFGLAAGIYIARFYKRIRIPIELFLMYVVIAIDLLSFIYGDFSTYQWVRMSVYYIALTFFIFCSLENGNAKKVLLSFTAGYLTVCILSLIMVIPVVGMADLVSSNYRFGSASLRDFLDPLGIVISFENDLGIASAIVFSMMIVLMRSCTKGKLIYFMVSIFAIFMAMLAKSNTGFVLIICAVLCYLWSIRQGVKQFVSYMLLFVFLVGVIYWFVSTNYPQLLDSILSRILVNDISNGRTEILKLYFQRMLDNPKFLLFGTGSQNYADKLQIVDSCHNALEQVFVMWGASGLVLVVALVVSAWKFMCKGLANRSLLFLSSIPFILFVLGAQAGQFDGFFPLLLPSLYALRLGEEADNPLDDTLDNT